MRDVETMVEQNGNSRHLGLEITYVNRSRSPQMAIYIIVILLLCGKY